MSNEWISHDRSNYGPHAVKGLSPDILIEVEELSGEFTTYKLGQITNWAAVVSWRPVSERPKALSELGAMSVQTTLNERKNTHGDFTTQSQTVQDMKVAFRGCPLWATMRTDQREALDMIAGKISRILHGNPDEPDHWRDIAGYATLVENRLVHGKSHLG